MIKFDTIGMIEHSEKNFPYIKAHEAMSYWSLVSADFTNNISLWPTVTTKKGWDLYLVNNNPNLGDAYSYLEPPKIKADEKLNCVSLKALDQQFLEIDAIHIDFGASDYNAITPGTTMLGVSETGKFEVIANNTGYKIYLLITGKLQLTGDAVRARLIALD